MKKNILLLLFGTVTFAANAQPFSKNYILSFHTCDSLCTGFQDHVTHLAESNDGLNWTLVPNFPTYQGSVPDVITRGNKLYVFNPGTVKRYDNSSGTWDATPVPVSITESNSTPISFVDPSAILDSAGNIVLFFLDATGNIGDPAGCSRYPCVKHFRSATEVSGSDGTHFIAGSGDRIAITLNQSPATASDPDIYFDGSQYILYVSEGPGTFAASGPYLNSTYTAMPNLSSGTLVQNMGGIPCGYYDASTSQYWTYVHSNVNSSVVIRRATHSDFNSALTNFTTVLSGPLIGEPANTTTESPGFCVNTLLTSVPDLQQVPMNADVYPNPASSSFTITLNKDLHNGQLRLCDLSGRCVMEKTFSGKNVEAHAGGLEAGVYIAIVSGGGQVVRKRIVVR